MHKNVDDKKKRWSIVCGFESCFHFTVEKKNRIKVIDDLPHLLKWYNIFVQRLCNQNSNAKHAALKNTISWKINVNHNDFQFLNTGMSSLTIQVAPLSSTDKLPYAKHFKVDRLTAQRFLNKMIQRQHRMHCTRHVCMCA